MGLKKKYKKLRKKNLELWTKLEHASKLLAEAALEIYALRRQVPPVKGKHTERDLLFVCDDPQDPAHKAKKDWESSLVATLSTPGANGKFHTMEIHAPNAVQLHRVCQAFDRPVGKSDITLLDDK